MKRAVSISIGSSKRDKAVEVDLLGERVRIERIGTDGDMQAAADRYAELDGKVDAFGVGGADLGLEVDGKWYPLYSVKPMVSKIKITPVVDGTGLKNTLEAEVARILEEKLPAPPSPKRALVTIGADRWGMTVSFLDAGYECTFGDLMFSLGIPIALHSRRSLTTLAGILMPVAGRLPFKWVYPTGEQQEIRTPKWTRYYHWATVIAGDCHYIKKYMPHELPGKIIVTNTTTEEDVALFKSAGISYLITTTPVLEGRSFGTNMMEAALVAVAGKGRALTRPELRDMLHNLNMEPQVHPLNP
jgi:hypothetical protein